MLRDGPCDSLVTNHRSRSCASVVGQLRAGRRTRMTGAKPEDVAGGTGAIDAPDANVVGRWRNPAQTGPDVGLVVRIELERAQLVSYCLPLLELGAIVRTEAPRTELARSLEHVAAHGREVPFCLDDRDGSSE